jgi:hypothetical protein
MELFGHDHRHNHVRVLVAAPVLVAAFVAFSSSAAGSCVELTLSERGKLADVVVYGTVTETRQTFVAAGGVIRFRPERYLKGTLPGEIQVYLGPSKGGAVTSVDYEAVRRGDAHTLYLRSAGDGSWQTDACSGSHAGAPTSGETTFFGEGTLASSPATSADPLIVVVAIAIAAVTLAATTVVLRGR